MPRFRHCCTLAQVYAWTLLPLNFLMCTSSGEGMLNISWTLPKSLSEVGWSCRMLMIAVTAVNAAAATNPTKKADVPLLTQQLGKEDDEFPAWVWSAIASMLLAVTIITSIFVGLRAKRVGRLAETQSHKMFLGSRVTLLPALLLCSWFYCSRSQGPQLEITVYPVSVVAPLGSNATFNCSVANASTITWEINRVQFESGSEKLRSSNIFLLDPIHHGDIISSSLVVTATEENNGTTVQCLGVSDRVHDVPVQSDIVNLTVYGRPHAPENLSITVLGPLRLNISWSAPESLPQVELSYRVSVVAVNTSEHCESGQLTEAFYKFESNNATCDYYTVSVIAMNDAGSSNHTQVDNVALPTLPTVTLKTVEHSLELISGNFSCQFTVAAAEACPAYPVTNYSLTLTTTGELADELVTYISTSTTLTVTEVEENVKYTYTLQAHNEIGAATYNSGVFYTTDIQDPQVVVHSKNVTVECRYVNGSIAQGCFIELSFPNGTLYALANASRNEGQKVILTMLPAYCYNISVYDWEEDGSMGDLPIPVSQAVWNDSCSTPTAPPSSASDTTDIQDVRVVIHSKSVTIECRYVKGSVAQGCFVELSFPNGTLYALANASRNEGEKVISTTLPAHCYNISVFDWEEDGSMGDLPIPVSQAVWNDSCSTPSITPPLETEPKEKDEFPMVLLVVAVGIIAITLIVAVLVVIIVMCARSYKTRTTSTVSSDQGHYAVNARDKNGTTAAMLGATNASARHTAPEEPIYHQIQDFQVSAPTELEYSLLNRPAHQPPLHSSPTGVAISSTSPQDENTHSDYAELNQLPVYQLLESSNELQAHKQQGSREYQEIAELQVIATSSPTCIAELPICSAGTTV